MANNIILPQVSVIAEPNGYEKFIVETDGELKRLNSSTFIKKEDLNDIAYVGDIVEEATGFINADTLGGKTENMLYVAKAIDADNLGGAEASNFVQKNDLKPKAGFIYPLATPNVPDGFLLCDGKAYSRTEYVELFAAIGTYYGSGDGSTTFNVPNLQTRVPVGAGDGYELGSVGGEEKHTLTVDELPNIQGTLPHMAYGEYKISGVFSFEKSGASNYEGAANSEASNDSHYLMNFGNDQPHNNMQPYTVVNYIIATGKDSAVYIRDVINGAQAIPLEVQYGGTGALNADDARKNLGIREHKQNLLDNSDFRNPVNQRGKTTYTGFEYKIDRWRSYFEDSVLTVQNGYISVRNNGVIQLCPCEDGVYSAFGCNTNGELVPLNKWYNSELNAMTVDVPVGDWLWAAMYEGEYTAETLPPYVPKGYGAELVECQRYLHPIVKGESDAGIYLKRCGLTDWEFDTQYNMRIAPSLLIIGQPRAVCTNVGGAVGVVNSPTISTGGSAPNNQQILSRGHSTDLMSVEIDFFAQGHTCGLFWSADL